MGFAINNNLTNHLSELPISIDEHLMTLCLALASNQSATVISVQQNLGTHPKLLHNNMSVTVFYSGGGETEPFRVPLESNKGVIASTLFSVFTANILYLTGENLLQGVKIMYRNVENLLNMSRFRAKSKITTISVMKFQYANDALVFLSEEELQGFLDAFGKAYKQPSLALNIKKTQILCTCQS